MAITLKRQLDDEEKQRILERYGRKCFATGHLIPEGESVHFDHVRAYSVGGATELHNIAPMCADHNRAKGTLPLDDFRVKLQIEDFFGTGDRLTLRNLLEHMQSKGRIAEFGRKVVVELSDDQALVSNDLVSKQLPLYQCPRTGWKYFFATLPLALLDSDDDSEDKAGLQPRYLIFDKVFQMYRHFQNYPVLQPSIGRLSNENILLFDGQHKTAALLFNNMKELECKVYIDPDIRLLNQANISAHDKFAQTRFYSSIMVLKLGNQFGQDFEEYKSLDEGGPKTESDFVDFLRKKDPTMTKGDVKKRFRSYLMNSVLESEDNQLKTLISPSNRRSAEHPLTVDMLSKSLFAAFVYMEPLNDDLLSERYRRDDEFRNMTRLMNMIYVESLASWDPEASNDDGNQRALRRIFSSKSMMAWAELFRDAVCAKLDVHDADEKARPFYRVLSEEEFGKIRDIYRRLVSWQMWYAPKDADIDVQLSATKNVLKNWFRSNGLSTGYLMGAEE